MSHPTRLRYLGVALLLTSRLVACSSDSTPVAAAGAGGGSDASAGAGGKTGAAGKIGAGGSAVDAGVPYTQTVCPGGIYSPGLMKNFPSCDTICGPPSHCVTTSLAATQSTAIGYLPDCPDDGAHRPGKCIPDGLSDRLGKFIFKECTFFLDNTKGRCVPKCIALLENAAAQALSRDVCGAEEVCAPCTDPTKVNASTSACNDYCGGTADGGQKTDAGNRSDGGKKSDGG